MQVTDAPYNHESHRFHLHAALEPADLTNLINNLSWPSTGSCLNDGEGAQTKPTAVLNWDLTAWQFSPLGFQMQSVHFRSPVHCDLVKTVKTVKLAWIHRS